ncbi:MAG: penicillin-binding protein 2, partial [Silvanigrellaceae bacterium]|nr:penicillin-binding protein 2 [Silvanigrellaceae bacterium]
NGKILAVSVPRPSIFLLPQKIPNQIDLKKKVSQALGISLKQLEDAIGSKKNFIWIHRQLTPQEFAKIPQLKKWFHFIGVVEEPIRIYPEKELASHLIGFVGANSQGLEGIEKVYNDRLTSKTSKVNVARDARGHLVMVTPNDATKPEQDLEPLFLSIDVSVQEFVQNSLANAVEKTKARGGSAIVLDIQTGEALAIASYPTFDLNHPPESNAESRRFRAIMDALELGSIVKPMFIARALDKGIISIDQTFWCEKGQMSLPGGTIHDTHHNEWLTAQGIIKVSSNIGIYKIVQKMGRELFYDSLMKIGFGRSTATGFPGEWPGRVSKPEFWKEMRFANMAFGQGFAISPLQYARALSILAGGGKDKGIHFTKTDPLQSNKNFIGPLLEYIKPETSKLITKMMESVFEQGGTAAKIGIRGYQIAAKTGTAQKYVFETNSYSEYIASFVGVLPAEQPRLAIVIVIDNPAKGMHYGGNAVGPVFAEIGNKTIKYLNSQGILSIEPNFDD